MPSPSAKAGHVVPKGNLTGIARHVRDLAADIHSNIQRWNKLHLQGYDILKSILQETHSQNNLQGLQDLCDALESVCDGLNEIVRNLGEIARQMSVAASLQKDSDTLFHTWPTKKFGQVAESIYEVYRREAEVKRGIFENAAHDTGESWKMLHLAGWVCQPLLADNLPMLVESLLTETGHR